MTQMTDDQIQEQADDVLADIDARGSSEKMSQENWKDFLTALIDSLTVRYDAIE